MHKLITMKFNFSKSVLLAAVATSSLIVSCEKPDETNPGSSNTGAKPTKVTFYADDDTIVNEYDANYVLTKRTYKRNTGAIVVQYVRTSTSLKLIVDGAVKEEFSLNAKGLITQIDTEYTLQYNSEDYLIKALENGNPYLDVTYTNGNVSKEIGGGESISYDYYTDKTDLYRLNGFLGEDDGIMGLYELYPACGKASKNLLKKITYSGETPIDISYEFDANGYPTKVIGKENGAVVNTFKVKYE